MDNFVDNVDNFYSVEVNCYKIVTFVTKYIHNLLNCQTIYDAFASTEPEKSAVFMTHFIKFLHFVLEISAYI